MKTIKYIGIILLGLAMGQIYPIKDWKDILVTIAFWIGLNLFILGEIEDNKGD